MDIVEELCHKRRGTNFCILVQALGDQNVWYILNKLENKIGWVTLIALSHGTVDYVNEVLSDNTCPRVIIATAIAFTGVTFEQCDVVITPGLFRRPVMNKITGLTELIDGIASAEKFEQICGRAGRDTDKGVVLSLQPAEFRKNYAVEYQKSIFPDLSEWIVFKLKNIENNRDVSVEDFSGLGFDNAVDMKYAMKAMYLSTGLINCMSFAAVKSKKILNLAAHCQMDYKRSFSSAFCRGIESTVAANFVCSLEAVLQSPPNVASLVSTKIMSTSTAEQKRLKNERTSIKDMIATQTHSQFGGEIYNIIKLLDKLDRQLSGEDSHGTPVNHILYDINAVKQCLRRRNALYKIWQQFKGSDAVGEYQSFFKLYSKRKRTPRVELYLIQMAITASHILQLCYVEYDEERREKIFIWHSGHEVYVDNIILSWP